MNQFAWMESAEAQNMTFRDAGIFSLQAAAHPDMVRACTGTKGEVERERERGREREREVERGQERERER